MAALDLRRLLRHIIVHTGQNYDYELNQIFFDDLGFINLIFFLMLQVQLQLKQ
jgi:UDP-N-acetylglucosamine 2-epimerase (non-hydrolysing)